MKLSHIIFPHKEKTAQLNIQLSEQIKILADFILANYHLYPNNNHSAAECAVQIITDLQKQSISYTSQIENYKIGAKELQRDLTENKEKFETMKGNLESIIEMDERNHKIQILSLQKQLSDLSNALTPAKESNHTREGENAIKEYKRRNGVQSATILALQLQLADYKKKYEK